MVWVMFSARSISTSRYVPAKQSVPSCSPLADASQQRTDRATRYTGPARLPLHCRQYPACQSDPNPAHELPCSRRVPVAGAIAMPAASFLGSILGIGVPLACAESVIPPDATVSVGGGIEYFDRVIGGGSTALPGDLIRIIFTAHTFDPSGVERNSTFDPFGSGGSSNSRGYKYMLGQHDPDLPPGETNPPAGFERGILGGQGVVPMKQGGIRVIRMPAEMAYGSYGHHCKYGVKTACEVPPMSPVEFEVQFVDFV